MKPRLVDRAAAAAHLGVCVSTFKKRFEQHFTRVPICAKVLFDLEDIDRWVDAQKVSGLARNPKCKDCRAALTSDNKEQ